MEHISGQYIKHLREERGLPLRAFAEMIYASKSSVYRWEQAHVPENEDILQRIAAVFGTDVATLREGSAQFTARQADARAADGAESGAATLHSQGAAEAQTEGGQGAAKGAQSAASGALPITGGVQIAAETAQGGAAGGAEEAQAEGDDDFGLDPDQVAEMKFGIKWLGWAVGLLAAALVSMAVFAAL